MHKIVTKATTEKASPFRMTKQEKEMLDPNYKKPKKKVPRCLTFLFYLHPRFIKKTLVIFRGIS